MNYKDYLLIVPGEPNSIFFEIFFKSLKKLKIKNPIIIIASEKLIKMQMKKLKFKKKIMVFTVNNFAKSKINNKSLNLINIDYKVSNAFGKISSKSNKYINNCFETAFKIIKKYKLKKFINGPINKKTFLSKKYPGITEFIASKFNIKKMQC